MKHRLLTALIAIAALALAATPAALADNPNKDKDTYVQLLAINDFHGHVESTTPGNIIDSTGAMARPAARSTSRPTSRTLGWTTRTRCSSHPATSWARAR